MSCAEFAACFAGSANRASVKRSGRPIPLARAGHLSGVSHDHKPGVIGSPIDIEGRVRRVGPIVQREERGIGKRRLERDSAGPDAGGEQRGRDVGALSGAFAPVKRRDDCRIQAHRRCMVAAACHRQRRRGTRISRQRQQAASRPIGRDVESRKLRVRPVVAVAGDVRIDQPRIPLRDIVIAELQFLASGMRRVDDQNVGPLDQPLAEPASPRATSDRAPIRACCDC